MALVNNIKLLKTLKDLNKPYFTVADLEKILDLERNILYVTLNRLVKNGTLIRLKRNVYIPEFQSFEIERIANELHYPSYLSFESALSKYGILSQIPYCLTYATTKNTKRINLGSRQVEYKKLSKKYFFGYKIQDGIYIAEPEKAILDQLYMISKGKSESDISEWSLVSLNKSKLLKYSKKFPKVVQKTARLLILT